MSSGQALREYLASRFPDPRISLCELSTDHVFEKVFNVVQKVILLLLAVKTQIFAILNNLVHRLQTQGEVVTLRAAKSTLECTMCLEIVLTAVVRASTFIILAVTLVFRFEIPLTVAKRSSQFIGYVLLQAYLINFMYYSVESLEAREPLAFILFKPLSDFC